MVTLPFGVVHEVTGEVLPVILGITVLSATVALAVDEQPLVVEVTMTW